MSNKYKNKIVGGYRSKLEEFCAKELKKENIPFEYETLKVVLQEGFTFDNPSFEKNKNTYSLNSEKIRPITYTPDFIGASWIIEVKGRETTDFKIKWKMFKKWLKDNNSTIALFKPTNQKQVLETIKYIKYELSSKYLRKRSESANDIGTKKSRTAKLRSN